MLAGTLIAKNHFDCLAAQVAADHCPLPLAQGRFVNIKFIRVNGTLHHGFAQAIGSIDQHHLIKTGFGIQREHHAAGAHVAAHHLLHRRRQRYILIGITLMQTVGNRAVVIQ